MSCSCQHVAWMSRWATCMPLMTCCGVPSSENILKKTRFLWNLMILRSCGCWNFRILQDTLSILSNYTPKTHDSSIHLVIPLAKCLCGTSVFCPTIHYSNSFESVDDMPGWRSPQLPKGRRSLNPAFSTNSVTFIFYWISWNSATPINCLEPSEPVARWVASYPGRLPSCRRKRSNSCTWDGWHSWSS